MDGLKKNVRKTPVSRMTTNAYSAISPSRNVQWSGKIFRIAFFRNPAPPSRSSKAPASELPFIATPHTT